ncbi:hypothetical protein [Castellaniella sp.]|uniref:hypothetical protein n=1 Tax=Castellaniella sp. TaxID=1955812 RepID=UPI003C74DEDF
MYKKSLLAILTFVLCASHAWAADEQGNWIAIAASSSVAYSAKGESGGLMNVSGKKGNAYGYVYQIENKKNKTFSYGKVFVMLDACKKGYGQVIYNDMQGKFTDAIDFVRFGGTVADGLGSVACSAWDGETGKISRAETAGRWELAAKATESGNEFVLKTDTVRKSTYSGKPAITALFGYKDLAQDTTDYGVYTIRISDCKKGFGTIYESDLKGKQVGKSDVALDGRSVISHVASALCRKL